MNNLKKNSKVVTIFLSIGLMILVLGFSYAFFIYNKTGLYTHTITGGKMKVIYDETTGNNITIENAYPITDEEAETKALEFEFTITGYNESDKNIYYAIEMDHGSDINGKNRFLDTDIKLTLFENDELIFENEIFENLDNQDIHYGYFKAGTNSQTPTINNYKLRIWIGDNVIISDTLSSDLSTWNDADWKWFSSRYNTQRDFEDDLYYTCPEFYYGESNECSLDDFGMKIYTSDEFQNRYANFKVNVRADLNYKNVDYLMYDANGGEFTPKNTSLLTNRVTMQKPVMENKGFLGWSSDPIATIPEYKAGEHYSGTGKMLYAVYGDKINVMEDLSMLDEYESMISELYFINDAQENIDLKYNNAAIKFNLTHPDYTEKGKVLCWLEEDYYDENEEMQYYKLYVASEGTTYLTNGKKMFENWVSLCKVDFSNIDTSMVTDMSYMFGGYYDDEDNYHSSSQFSELNLESFNTSNVTNMSYMFADLQYIDFQLDLSGFDTSKVTDMSYMFRGTYPDNIGSGDDFQLNLEGLDTSNVETMEGMFINSTAYIIDLTGLNTGKVKNMSYMFGLNRYGYGIRKIIISGLDTSNVEDFSYMFAGCKQINELDVSNFDTGNGINFEGMFYETAILKSSDTFILDVSKWDISKAMNISRMFASCGYTNVLDIKNWDTSNVINMSGLFSGNTFTEMDISNWNFESVTDISYLFSDCENLTDLNMNGVDTSNVINMSSLFESCSSLKSIDLSNFDTRNVTDMSYMFSYTNFESIGMGSQYDVDLSLLDTSKVVDMSGLFCGCSNLLILDLNYFDTSLVANMSSIFESCSNLSTVDLSTINTSQVTDMSYMFCDTSFESIGTGSSYDVDLSSLNTSKLTNITSMFKECYELKIVDLSNFDMSHITQICKSGSWDSSDGLFESCYELENIIWGNFNTSQVTTFSSMFYYCESLIELDLSNFDTSNVIDMNEMFYYCKKLTKIKMNNFDTSDVTDMSDLFYGCYALTELNINAWDVSNVTSFNRMFHNCYELKELDLSSWVTESAVDMGCMFWGCKKIESVKVDLFDTSGVTDMIDMFRECESLINLDLSSFDTSQVTDMYMMFSDCYKLESLDISNFTFKSSVDKMYIFYNTGKNLASGYTKVYVKSTTEQNWVLSLSLPTKPSGWSTSNVIVKSS